MSGDLTHSLPRSKISTTFGRWRDQHSQKIVLLPIASKFGPQEVNRLVDPPNRVKCIAKIGMKACTQWSRQLFPELFATDKPNYVTLSYKYNAGIQPE